MRSCWMQFLLFIYRLENQRAMTKILKMHFTSNILREQGQIHLLSLSFHRFQGPVKTKNHWLLITSSAQNIVERRTRTVVAFVVLGLWNVRENDRRVSVLERCASLFPSFQCGKASERGFFVWYINMTSININNNVNMHVYMTKHESCRWIS